jgi:dolichol kinase
MLLLANQVLILQWFCHRSLQLLILMGFLQNCSLESIMPGLVVISLAATILESLPLNKTIDDNVSVPLLVFLLGTLFL